MTDLKVFQSLINEYQDVFNRTVTLIFQSEMLLDEDVEILSYYWRENLYSNQKFHLLPFTITSSLCIATIAFIKTQFYTAAVLTLIPPTTLIFYNWKTASLKNQMKTNVQNLIAYLKLNNKLNKGILEHFRTRNSAVANLREASRVYLYTSFSKSADDFLINACNHLITLVQKLINAMADISQAINVEELNFVYFTDWNLEQYTINNDDDKNIVLSNFEKLSDIYILVSSNLLASLGLSVCCDLWKTSKCNVVDVFKNIIPDLLMFVKIKYDILQKSFNNIRFTLLNTIEKTRKSCTVNHQLELPFVDFLQHLQIMFELGLNMKYQLEKGIIEDNLESLSETLNDINKQIVVCKDILSSIGKLLKCNNKSLIYKENSSCESNQTSINTKKESKIFINLDDPPETLKDEVYTLSLHGSDEENDDVIESTNHYDELLKCIATQKLMIQELNKKLYERREKKGIKLEEIPIQRKKSKQLQTKLPAVANPMETTISLPSTSLSPPTPAIPPPPPAPMVPKLQPITANIGNQSERTYIAQAVKDYAKQLNREEEVFCIEPEEEFDEI